MKNELRYGYVCELYYRHAGVPVPNQLELLEDWFPGLIVKTEPGDDKTKKAPSFDENEGMIHAVKYHGRFYTGGDLIISQLCGRLIGTAKGSREKQRKNAVLVQKRLCRFLHENYEEIERLIQNTADRIFSLEDDAFSEFAGSLIEFICSCAMERDKMSAGERDGEAFPMDDEIFDTVLCNSAYQYQLYTMEGLAKSYLWLLLGSLLRSETGRLTRRFNSGFIEVNRAAGEDSSLLSRLDFLLFPEDYEYVYEGDDVESRFPDIVWKCDFCGDILNDQPGFDDRLGVWQCRRCGALSLIQTDQIYECEEDAVNQIRPWDEQKFRDAIERRKAELIQNEGK